MSLGRCVTQEQAKTILEQLECLVSEDEVDQFTEWLNAIAETIRPLVRIAELYAKADGSIAMLRRSLPQIVSNLVEMEVGGANRRSCNFRKC